MNYNIIIKISINGSFEERKCYELLLEYTKVSNIISLENNYIECESILKYFDGKIITMQYVGISRVDSKKIFLIDVNSVKRQLILNELGV
jgi:hypothetical protein